MLLEWKRALPILPRVAKHHEVMELSRPCRGLTVVVVVLLLLLLLLRSAGRSSTGLWGGFGGLPAARVAGAWPTLSGSWPTLSGSGCLLPEGRRGVAWDRNQRPRRWKAVLLVRGGPRPRPQEVGTQQNIPLTLSRTRGLP